jgi:hypothetical protein
MKNHQTALFNQGAQETTMRKKITQIGLGLGALALATLNTGCAVLVNDHGTNGGITRTSEVGLGINAETANGIANSTKDIPILGTAINNVFRGSQMHVDEQGRTVMDVPRQNTQTQFCITGHDPSYRDCSNPAPSNSGLYQRTAPDQVSIACQRGSQQIILDPPDPKQTSLLICKTGNGMYSAPTLTVNGQTYAPACKDNNKPLGVLRVNALKAGDYVNAGTCIPR